jgi:acyl-CoA synthetase (AMP-forming)/AMP-acid ligase II
MVPVAASLGELLTELVSRHGDRLAVACEERALSFRELDRDAGCWAAALQTAGIGPGKHVGLLAANGVDWPAVAFGVWRAGATLVPISTFVTARELEETLEHADIEVLITQAKLRSHDYLEMIAKIALHGVRRVVVLGEEATDWTTATEFLLQGERQFGHTRPVDPESIACILYTSGTTGRPKGVRLSHRAIVATVGPTATRSGLSEDDSMLSTLPLFWVAGLVIRALPTWATGCGLLFIETFTPEGIVEILDRRRPTALHLRPPQVAELLRHRAFRPELLSQVHRGNGRVEWFNGLIPDDARFITGYGMTEMAGYVTALDSRDSEEERASGMGTPLPHVEIRIVDDHGCARAAGETGQILVRGPGMFSGYHKEPPTLGLDADGWFVTGDLGALEADGTFRFIGRSKDLLRIKGINVSPIEVERILAVHERVEAVYAVGIPSQDLDQRLVVLVVCRDAGDGVEEDLRRVAREQLSHYKRPDAYIFLSPEEIPFGATSKPQRAALATLAMERLGPSAAEDPQLHR